MPEEAKLERESNGKFEKDIYVNSKEADKLIEDCATDYSKPVKAKMVTEMLNGCYEEVILLMGNDCNKELMTEGDVISDGSDLSSIDDESLMGSMVLREELKMNDDVIDSKISSDLDNDAKNKEFQELNKKTDVTSPMASYVIQEPNSLVYNQEKKQKDRDHKNVNVISGNEVEESVNISQHCSGDIIPYSGSVSLRSASSTASTRSFAFPTLAQEWNSYTSPVRMATPDKTHTVKQKLWNKKMNWICCIF